MERENNAMVEDTHLSQQGLESKRHVSNIAQSSAAKVLHAPFVVTRKDKAFRYRKSDGNLKSLLSTKSALSSEIPIKSSASLPMTL